jgi:hypothetical protein
LTLIFGSCLQDIVGARFHCVACDSVDICSNCESVGLPGNLDSSDGGHDSSHIMIKVCGFFSHLVFLTHEVSQIPYPVEPSKVQEVSHRAMARWNGGDAEHVGLDGLHLGAHHHGRHLRSRSRRSSFDGTVRLSDVESMSGLKHGVRCDSCTQVWLKGFISSSRKLNAVPLKTIIGTRYQCGNCTTIPHPYSLVCVSLPVSQHAVF